jgi:hypothetical protein
MNDAWLRTSLFGLLGAFHENKSVVWNKDVGCAFGFYQSRSVSRIQEKARRRGVSRAFPSQTEEVLLFAHIVSIIYCNFPSESSTQGCARSFRPDRQKTNCKRTVRPFPVEHVPVRRHPASFAARSSPRASSRMHASNIVPCPSSYHHCCMPVCVYVILSWDICISCSCNSLIS